jgi:hypothetical protein
MIVSWELMVIAGALGVLPAVLIAAAADGSASGWLEVKGQRVALKYAFAAMSEDVLQGDGKEKIEVLLSDKPVPAELRKATDGWNTWAGDQAEKGELHGIIVYLDPDTKVWSRGQKLSQQHGMEFYSESVSSPELSDLIFAPVPAGTGEVAGKVSMKKAMRGVDEDAGPWRVEVEFRTPIVARPAVTASYAGAEARNSAPYKAVQAHLQACQKKDLEAVKESLSLSSQQTLAKFEAAMGKQAVLEMFAEEAAGTMRLKLTKVTVRGDTAQVVFSGDAKESGGEQLAMVVVLESGIWKIGQ